MPRCCLLLLLGLSVCGVQVERRCREACSSARPKVQGSGHPQGVEVSLVACLCHMTWHMTLHVCACLCRKDYVERKEKEKKLGKSPVAASK